MLLKKNLEIKFVFCLLESNLFWGTFVLETVGRPKNYPSLRK